MKNKNRIKKLSRIRKDFWNKKDTDTPQDATKQRPVAYNKCLASSEYQLSLLASQVAKEVFPPKQTKRVYKTRPSKKQAQYQEMIKLFLLNCSHDFVFLRNDHQLALTHLKHLCNVSKKSRYRELRPIPKSIKRVIDFLDSKGFVNQVIGKAKMEIIDGEWTVSKSTPTIIYPSENLKKFINLCRITEEKEMIQVKRKVYGEKYLVDFQETKGIKKMRKDMTLFSELVTKHKFSIGEKEFTPDPIYRLFRSVDGDTMQPNDSVLGGRFWGGISRMKRADRRNILVDGEETIEVDFSAMHVTLAYQKYLKVGVENPYILYPTQSKALRKIIKKIVNIGINTFPENGESGFDCIKGSLRKIINQDAKKKAEIVKEYGSDFFDFEPELEIPVNVYQNVGSEKGSSFYYNGAPDADSARQKCDYSLTQIIYDVIARHKKLFDIVWSTKNVGLSLQKIESDIMLKIMSNNKTTHLPKSMVSVNEKAFTFNRWYESYKESNMIFLPIHDGILTKKKWAKTMKNIMESAAKKYKFDLVAVVKQ